MARVVIPQSPFSSGHKPAKAPSPDTAENRDT